MFVSGEIFGGIFVVELEVVLWSEIWCNLLMILFLGVYYGVVLLFWNNSDLVVDYLFEEGVFEKLEGSLCFVIGEIVGYIGVMLMLIVLLVGIVGIIECFGMLELLLDVFVLIWIVGLFLVVVLVLVGMFIDLLGVVILVNVIFVLLVVVNGIVLLYFWMIVLVVFEFGYLMLLVVFNYLLF